MAYESAAPPDQEAEAAFGNAGVAAALPGHDVRALMRDRPRLGQLLAGLGRLGRRLAQVRRQDFPSCWLTLPFMAVVAYVSADASAARIEVWASFRLETGANADDLYQ